MSASDITLAVAVAAMIAGAAGTALTRDVTRLVVWLGTFLLSVAAVFLVVASSLLAIAQVFVYVGGVLVLVLFALMVVRRDTDERVGLDSVHDIGAAAVAIAVFAGLVALLLPLAGTTGSRARALPDDIGAFLLGDGAVAFEIAGVLLLVALLAVLVVVKGGEDR